MLHEKPSHTRNTRASSHTMPLLSRPAHNKATLGRSFSFDPSANNTDTHPFPPCSAWLSVETLDMHCTIDDHCRHFFRLLKKKAGSPNSACRARCDSCIRQCGPSTTARLCHKHQNAFNNPSLALQLYAEQRSQSSFSANRI